MNLITTIFALVVFLGASLAQATVYTGAMDTRAGHQFIPGMTAQSQAWISGGDPGVGVRLEWQADNVTNPGSWTYTYRLLRGNSKTKGFAFFDIETASDFTAANILSKQVTWAVTKTGAQLSSGLAGVTISNPVNFNAVHNFTDATVTEPRLTGTAPLNKSELSHYSGDPGIAPNGQPGLEASATPSVGPVPHPFYGIRVTFPGTLAIIAYEAVEWEFKIVSDRPPMWGSFFGWGDQTAVSPFWYSNMYNNNIDNPVRLTLPPASSNFGESPYQGWILVPGHPAPLPADQAGFLTVDRATYSRDASGAGQMNLFATSQQNTNIRLTVSGSGFASPVVMSPDTTTPFPGSKHLASIPFTSLPVSVLLDNSADPAAVAPYPVTLVDEVNISQAVFNPLTRTITINAESLDKMAPLPTLTAVDFAAPNQFDPAGTFTASLAANPPSTVTVTSSKGGFATAKVKTYTPPPASGATLIPDKASPQPQNTPGGVTFNATGTGGSGSYEFEFWMHNGTSWSKVQNYSATSSLHWNTLAAVPGAVYTFEVHVRNAGSAAVYEASQAINYIVTAGPATGATLTPSKTSPQPLATAGNITFAAAGQGGSGSYEFEFWLHDGTSWALQQVYSTTANWIWNAAAGSTGVVYTMQVNVRNAGSTDAYQAYQALNFILQ